MLKSDVMACRDGPHTLARSWKKQLNSLRGWLLRVASHMLMKILLSCRAICGDDMCGLNLVDCMCLFTTTAGH